MGLGDSQSGGGPVRAPDGEEERRRLSVFGLVGLAAGGVIGSGWLIAAGKAYQAAGADAVWTWVIGGAVMLVIAFVMVELGTAAPKTGGLIFLPLQSSGPLVATVVAAGLWIFYAVNSASEAAAMTQGLASWCCRSALYRAPSGDLSQSTLTYLGLASTTLFLMVIVAVNLLAQRLFVKANLVLTLLKVLIVVLVVAGLFASHFDVRGLTPRHTGVGNGFGAALAAVAGGGAVYAYTGFQGPLDFAGNIRRGGIGEAARLRWAIYGTIAGSVVLYTLLQVAFLGHTAQYHDPSDSPWAQFAHASGVFWLVWLLRPGAILSPMGSGLVFTHALTREVAALSRAHLTHRGLQTARNSSFQLRGRRYDVYWMVLLVDFAIGVIALLAVGGRLEVLIAMNSVLTLVVYAVPGIVLVSLAPRLAGYSPRRGAVHWVLARLSFVSIALVLYFAGWADLWRGLAALAAGSVMLLGLPLLARWDPPVVGRLLRKYDAKEHATLFRQWRTSPAAAAAVLLLAYLAVLTLLTLLGKNGSGENPWIGIPVAGTAATAFQLLVAASKRHMGKVPPTLPAPGIPAPAAALVPASGPSAENG